VLRPDWLGGEPYVVGQLISGLRELGHSVSSGSLPGSATRLFSMATSPVDWDLRSVDHYRKVLTSARPDVVLGFYDYDMALCEASARTEIPYVACVHIHWPECPIGILYVDGAGVCSGPGLKKCLRHMSAQVPDARLPFLGSTLPPMAGIAVYAKFSSRHASLVKANAIVVPSLSAKSKLEGAGYVNVHVVPNGIDVTGFPITPVPDTDVRRLLLPGSSPSERKGYGDFVSAAGKVRQRYPGVEFVATNALGQVGVSGLPRLSRGGMIQEYVRSYAVITPYLWDEPFGLVIAEAMAAARPVIAYDSGAIRELVADGITGALVPRGDVHQLVAAIMDLLERPEVAASMGRAGRDRVSREFTSARMALGYQSVIESVVR
jgi:glycosyltransferase involved in cell wall biosynthesis